MSTISLKKWLNLLARLLNHFFNISNVFYILLIFVPITIILDIFFSIDNTVLFALSVLALIPLAKLVGDTTEHLAEHYGNTGGSLINVTFSNTPEIILSIVAIQAGLFDLVKANIVGSILGQLLLVFGLSLIVGGLKFREQIFNKKNIVFHITLLLISITILSIPTILILGNLTVTEANIENQMESTGFMVMILSNSFAILLLSVYVLSLFFTFKTHKDLFVTSTNETDLMSKPNSNAEILITKKIDDPRIWSKKKAIGILAISMIGIAIISEILVSTVEETITNLNLGVLFVGAIIIGIVGNVPEKITSMMMARKGKLDLALGIAANSASQIALFVLPVIIVGAMIMGVSFPLIFTPFELITMFASIFLVYFITNGGRGNWFQGVILVGFFIAIALGFYFIK
ncbi:calcium/proton exchanger [Candidatus Nitrosocosmicus arcticus]|uniref:Putative calcium/cation antiporter family protein n=1 Tax=Candidatus Nitrosocosmicus arcticus TaxID=2035267 RepID=A0A557SUA0_9ARCH|nr:calcium/proton exchanger [Candidatus Nitrosocosmicus arcticus]TVP40180.1 putative calcium/cation antiporter family protein [Candidatus Nitrosocosmicus arcticus]